MASSSQAAVSFFFDEVSVTLRDRKRLKEFIRKLFNKEGGSLASLNYIFCSDSKLLQINRDFLQHDFYTDIITFDLSSESGLTEGEIYISIDRVRENAQSHDTTPNKELHRVIFHGALHLCGYKDKSRVEVETMRKAEDRYLKSYFK
jgi:probable rRNA maturation factor